jgi:hypothetical protein
MQCALVKKLPLNKVCSKTHVGRVGESHNWRSSGLKPSPWSEHAEECANVVFQSDGTRRIFEIPPWLTTASTFPEVLILTCLYVDLASSYFRTDADTKILPDSVVTVFLYVHSSGKLYAGLLTYFR